jgi:hypothetical protein
MTAWVKSGTREEIGIITDYTDKRWMSSSISVQSRPSDYILFHFHSLTNFNTLLVETYLDIPHTLTKCGYACSDQYASFSSSSRAHVHVLLIRSASWWVAGYPSVSSIGTVVYSLWKVLISLTRTRRSQRVQRKT